MGDFLITLAVVAVIAIHLGWLFASASILREIRDLLKERLKGD